MNNAALVAKVCLDTAENEFFGKGVKTLSTSSLMVRQVHVKLLLGFLSVERMGLEEKEISSHLIQARASERKRDTL